MAGRGAIKDAHPIDVSHIKILRNGRWQTMFRPINPDRSFSGVSLAESFAEQYAARYGVDVGLICCADGGTSLEQWKAGGLLFENAVAQARLAQKTSVLSGILWHQGEADCAEHLLTTYKERFLEFMHVLCDALGLENPPFLIGGLGDFLPECTLDEELKNYTRLNRELQAIARENENVGFVSAKGLGANRDNLHFNADALYTFGIRYFNVLSEMIGDGVNTVEVHHKDNGQRTEMELL